MDNFFPRLVFAKMLHSWMAHCMKPRFFSWFGRKRTSLVCRANFCSRLISVIALFKQSLWSDVIWHLKTPFLKISFRCMHSRVIGVGELPIWSPFSNLILDVSVIVWDKLIYSNSCGERPFSPPKKINGNLDAFCMVSNGGPTRAIFQAFFGQYLFSQFTSSQ